MGMRPSEGGHWYGRDGTPCYEIVGKNGKVRPATLRDARKLDLLPSVTTIAPLEWGLVNWMLDQRTLAALTLPREPGEPDESLMARIKADATAQAEKAAERGTLIHAWIQIGAEGGVPPEEGIPFYKSAWDTLLKECGPQKWYAEKSFADLDYGGKVDLFCDDYLIDIKTKDFGAKDISKEKLWDNHLAQLAAYDNGLDGKSRKCGILFIDSKTAESRLVWATETQMKRGLRIFLADLAAWYARTGLGMEEEGDD